MTIGFLAWFYPWTKAFHIISMVAWMAGMLYRSIYRASTSVISTWRLAGERAFKVMQRPLLRQVAMIHNALSQIGALSDSMATLFCKLCTSAGPPPLASRARKSERCVATWLIAPPARMSTAFQPDGVRRMT